MSKTIFLSTVTAEFGPLRKRLAALVQRTKQRHVRHQDDFIQRGNLTLHVLEEEIRSSGVVLHVIGAESGSVPPAEQVAALLERRKDFATRFPEVTQLARQTQVTYTQWEAWLALYFHKSLCRYLVPGRFPSAGVPVPLSAAHQSQRDHADRRKQRNVFPTSTADERELYISNRRV